LSNGANSKTTQRFPKQTPRTKFKLRAQGNESRDEGVGDDKLGDLFQKELEKRRISSIDDIQDDKDEGTTQKSTGTGVVPPPQFAAGWGPQDYEEDIDDQLKRSRAIGSEGLDGLLPRGSQLLQLGATSFLAFGPFILFVLVSFAAVYVVFGDMFVHGGAPSTGPPIYYDVDDLLSDPTVDPMIPL
jgi:hypothetical protein